MSTREQILAGLAAASVGLGLVASCSAIIGLEDHEAFPHADASLESGNETGTGGDAGTESEASGGSAGTTGGTGGIAGAGGTGGIAGAGGLFGDVGLIASGMNELRGITTDSTRVYWTSKFKPVGDSAASTPGIYVWNKGSAAETGSLLYEDGQIERVVTDASRVYFLATGGLSIGVRSVDKTGNDHVVVIDGVSIFFAGLAVGATAAFAGRDNDLVGSDLAGANSVCFGEDPPCLLETGVGKVQAVTIAGGMVYYATPNAIRKRPADLQKAVSVEFLSDSKIEDIVGDDSYLYWIDLDGNVNRADLAASDASPTVTVLASGEAIANGNHIAVDDTHVFWTTNNGFVRAIAKTGLGEPIVIADGQQDPGYLTADPSGVYWTNQQDETVRWAPRNPQP